MYALVRVDCDYDSVDEVKVALFEEWDRAETEYNRLSEAGICVFLTPITKWNREIATKRYYYVVWDYRNEARYVDSVVLLQPPTDRNTDILMLLNRDGYYSGSLVQFYGETEEECHDKLEKFKESLPEYIVVDDMMHLKSNIKDGVLIYTKYGTRYMYDVLRGKLYREKTEYYRNGVLCTDFVASGDSSVTERKYWE